MPSLHSTDIKDIMVTLHSLFPAPMTPRRAKRALLLWPPTGRPLYSAAVVSTFFFLFSSPILSGRKLDDCHTSTHDVVLARI